MLDWVAFGAVFAGLPLLGGLWLVLVLPRGVSVNRQIERDVRRTAQEGGGDDTSWEPTSSEDVDARYRYIVARMGREKELEETIESHLDEIKRRVVEALREHEQRDLDSLKGTGRKQPLAVPRWSERDR